MKKFHKLKQCRICSNQDLLFVLDLGEQPPANSFLKKQKLKKTELKFPLRLFLCKKCFLLQLMDIVDKKLLFSKYLYLTSASKPIVNHFEKYAQDINKKFLKDKKNPLVIEIGSNDGTLLKNFKKFHVSVLGIEPSKNIAKIANKSGIPTKNAFFTSDLIQKLSLKRKATIIIANNVIAHIENIRDVMVGIKLLLDDLGVFVFEVPYLVDLIKKIEFDTIYHEHLSYFSLFPLIKLMRDSGLEIFDVKKQKVHGGTIRVFVAKKNSFKVKQSVKDMIMDEEIKGMYDFKIYQDFAKNVNSLKESLFAELKLLKKEGKRIFGYGASAKGNVLLNYCKIDTKIIDCIIDTTPLKHGLFTPGTHIPVKSTKIISTKGDGDVALLLAWNYQEEILRKEKNFRKKGGKFLIPIPILVIK